MTTTEGCFCLVIITGSCDLGKHVPLIQLIDFVLLYKRLLPLLIFSFFICTYSSTCTYKSQVDGKLHTKPTHIFFHLKMFLLLDDLVLYLLDLMVWYKFICTRFDNMLHKLQWARDTVIAYYEYFSFIKHIKPLVNDLD